MNEAAELAILMALNEAWEGLVCPRYWRLRGTCWLVNEQPARPMEIGG